MAGSKLDCVRSFVPGTFAFFAIIFGSAANFYCQSVKFVQDPGNDDLTLYVSPWNYRTKDSYQSPGSDDIFTYTTCRSYSYLEDSYGFNFNVDATTRTVWSFSIMTPVIGGLLLFFTCLGACMTVNPQRWKCFGILMVFMSIFQGLTLLITSSSICKDNPALQYLEQSDSTLAGTFSNDCVVATGYTLNIVAVVCWFLAGTAAIVLPAPTVIPEHPPQEQTVTYTQKPDGTVEETNVTVVKGQAVPNSPLEKD
jgi:hypothetical protein